MKLLAPWHTAHHFNAHEDNNDRESCRKQHAVNSCINATV